MKFWAGRMGVGGIAVVCHLMLSGKHQPGHGVIDYCNNLRS